MRLHESKIELEEYAVIKLGNAAINPNLTTVAHLYRCWVELNYGIDIDPIAKLQEKKGMNMKHT